MNIVFLGPQGSGKTTQAKLLAAALGLPMLSTGDLLRSRMREENEVGKRIRYIMERGELLDDKTMSIVLKEELAKDKYKQGVVIDGAPRTVTQAREFEEILRPDRVFYLSISDQEATKRLLKRGREDDTPELIKKRLALYHQETEPILSYYREKGVLEGIDGERSIEEIAQDIRERVND